MKKMLIGIMLLLTTVLLGACGQNNPTGTYTVKVVTEHGKPLEEIFISIYTDETQNEVYNMGKTDETGVFSFESEEGSVGCVICLDDVPLGYKTEEAYTITSTDTEIVLPVELLSEDVLQDVTFQLGDVFADMSVTAVDGKTYTISEILKEKKAVVLNFWYLNCAPCKIEFPHMQEAYAEYQDKLEIIAVNPVDGTDETIAEFQKKLELTFPMAVCSEEWASYMKLTAYPTTVVIDRYGTIGMIHRGGMEKADFVKIFEFFTAEDYEQSAVKLSEIE